MREAAAVAGVTPATIRRWVETGKLAAAPWTPGQIGAAARVTALSPPRGTSAPHGTPSRYRAGCDCTPCSTAHSADTAAWRFTRATEGARRWVPLLLDAIADGRAYSDALAAADVTAQAVTAHRHRDPDFAATLDQVLMAARDPSLPHGTATAWKVRCRCPECRNHHTATR